MENFKGLRCHFTWDELKQECFGRGLDINIEDLQEHIQDTIDGTQVESHNLMGYYKALQMHYTQARDSFTKALCFSRTEDQKLVALVNLAYLTLLEQTMVFSEASNPYLDVIEEVKRILDGRKMEDIPEVMVEKAFSIYKSGYNEEGFQEAYRCICLALVDVKPDNVAHRFIKANIMEDLHKDKMADSPDKRPEMDEMRENWCKILESIKNVDSVSLKANLLIESAIFFSRNKWDTKVDVNANAVQAQELATSNESIMRKVAQFYLESAKHDSKILGKAERIVDALLQIRPNPTKALYLKGLIFADKFKFASKEEKENYFNEARNSFYYSWQQRSKKLVVPALDLVELLKLKYDDTKDGVHLLDIDDFFREIFQDIDKLHNTSKALVHEKYGEFLCSYSDALCRLHHEKASTYKYRNGEKCLFA